MNIAVFYVIIFVFISIDSVSQTFSIQQLCDTPTSEIFGARSFNNEIYVVTYEGDSTAETNNKKNFTEISILNNCGLQVAELYSAKHKTNVPISSLKNDGPLSGNEDGNLLFFSNNSDSKLNFEMGIFYLKKSDSGWSESHPFPLNSYKYSCIHPFYDDVTQKLYFSSNMPEEGNKYSIYSIPFDGVNFGEHHLEVNISSEFNDLFPSLYNGKIYFTSDRTGGNGGMDIYEYSNDSTRLMPYPINSEYDDLAYFPLNEFSAFLSSNRKDLGFKDQTYFIRIKSSNTEQEILSNLESAASLSNYSEVVHSQLNFFKELSEESNELSLNRIEKTIFSSTSEVINNISELEADINESNAAITNNWNSFSEELESLLFNEDLSDLKAKISLEEELRMLVYQLNQSPSLDEKKHILDNLITKLKNYDPELADKLIPRLNEIIATYEMRNDKLASLDVETQSLKELIIVSLRQEALIENMSLEEYAEKNSAKLTRLNISPIELYEQPIGIETLKQIISKSETITFLFGFDSYSVNNNYKETLLDFINLTLLLDGIEIQLEGHTDNTGSAQYNLLLSEKRALSIKKQFIKNGLSVDIFKIRFFGINQPKFDNSTREGRRKNRRVEIKLVLASAID